MGQLTELASWPDAWRKRWGRLARALEADGVLWPNSEAMAFKHVKGKLERAGVKLVACKESPTFSGAVVVEHREIERDEEAVIPDGPRDVRRGDRWLPWHWED